jgi:hypothetical protein
VIKLLVGPTTEFILDEYLKRRGNLPFLDVVENRVVDVKQQNFLASVKYTAANCSLIR